MTILLYIPQDYLICGGYLYGQTGRNTVVTSYDASIEAQYSSWTHGAFIDSFRLRIFLSYYGQKLEDLELIQRGQIW